MYDKTNDELEDSYQKAAQSNIYCRKQVCLPWIILRIR